MDVFKAIEQGDAKAVNEFLTGGGNADVENDSGYTALHWATIMGHAEIASLLKTAGAVSNIFIEAAIGNLNAVVDLIESGVDVNATNSHGHTVLMTAAHQGHTDVVRALIAAKADVNGRHSHSGNTTLIGAAHQGHTEIVQILVDVKADVNVRNKVNGTALSEAINQGHTDVIDVLRAAGAQE